MPRIKLTEENLKQLPEIADKAKLARPVYFWDEDVKGLAARLHRDCSIAWHLKTSIAGRDRWDPLGKWPAVTSKDARSQATIIKGRIASGEVVKPAKLQVMGWEMLMDKFEAEHLAGKKDRTRSSYQSIINCHLRPAFKGKFVHEITADDIAAFHSSMADKPRQANIAVVLLKIAFERCEAWYYRSPNSNPVSMWRKSGKKNYPEKTRNREVTDDELRQIGKALVQMENEGHRDFVAFVRILIFSGARRGEVLSLRWSLIDEKRRLIKWDDSKTGAISKPLNDGVFEVLAGLPRDEREDWVFPSATSASGHLEDVKRGWKRMLELAGITTRLHRHDMRHLLGDTAADEGYGMQVVAALLSHKGTQTTERYSKSRKNLAPSNKVAGTLKARMGGK